MKDQISCGGESYFGMPLKDILTYLEKQKEQKPAQYIPKFKVGDKVLTSKYAGTEVKVDGVEYIILRQDDILAVVE